LLDIICAKIDEKTIKSLIKTDTPPKDVEYISCIIPIQLHLSA